MMNYPSNIGLESLLETLTIPSSTLQSYDSISGSHLALYAAAQLDSALCAWCCENTNTQREQVCLGVGYSLPRLRFVLV
jgi:hypothetical protein